MFTRPCSDQDKKLGSTRPITSQNAQSAVCSVLGDERCSLLTENTVWSSITVRYFWYTFERTSPSHQKHRFWTSEQRDGLLHKMDKHNLNRLESMSLHFAWTYQRSRPRQRSSRIQLSTLTHSYYTLNTHMKWYLHNTVKIVTSVPITIRNNDLVVIQCTGMQTASSCTYMFEVGQWVTACLFWTDVRHHQGNNFAVLERVWGCPGWVSRTTPGWLWTASGKGSDTHPGKRSRHVRRHKRTPSWMVSTIRTDGAGHVKIWGSIMIMYVQKKGC